MLSMPAFLRFYPVFCGLSATLPPTGVLRFFACVITREHTGGTNSATLARFLRFSVSWAVRVNSRPALPDAPSKRAIRSDCLRLDFIRLQRRLSGTAHPDNPELPLDDRENNSVTATGTSFENDLPDLETCRIVLRCQWILDKASGGAASG